MISPEYAAGFFDGEGCVNLTVSGRNRRIVLRLMIVNTDPMILAAFQAQFGGFIEHRVRQPGSKQAHWKQFCCLTMSGNIAFAFLVDIAPYVRVKASQVALALEFMELKRLPKNERCYYTARKTFGAMARIRPEILERENDFKRRMHLLNAKGIA